jgi:integrase
MIRKYNDKDKWICYKCKTIFDTPSERLIMTPLGKPKRKTRDLKVMTSKEILFHINKCESIKIKAFMAFLYLSGCRVNEVIKKVKAFQIEQKEINGQKYLLFQQIPILKRKDKYMTRNIPVHYEKEEPFIKIIQDYLDLVFPDDVLWDFSAAYAWKQVNKYTGMFPHFNRHLRLTHLVTEYGFNTQDLTLFTGWTNNAPANIYVHLNWMEIAKKMN